MNNQEIVAKLWNLCNVLRDDGITYHEYVTELTYILFLKMCKETGSEEAIPEGYRWDSLTSRSGLELKKHYQTLLSFLGENCTGRVREIYQGAQTKIDEPKNLEKIITTIDQFDWFTAKEEGLGNLYEGLLEKNANEKKVWGGTVLHAPRAHQRDDAPDRTSARRALQRSRVRNFWIYDCRRRVRKIHHRRFVLSIH